MVVRGLDVSDTTRMHRSRRPYACLAALLLGACASQTGELSQTGSLGPPPTVAPASVTQGAQTVSQLPAASGAGYQLTPTELELDCRKLTGRMAVRIVQIRDFHKRSQTTALSRGMQSVTAPVLGGNYQGIDPDGRYARDRAQLEAFNRRLAEKDCANFDLDAELKPDAKGPPSTRPHKS